jgi:hypothetical protein
MNPLIMMMPTIITCRLLSALVRLLIFMGRQVDRVSGGLLFLAEGCNRLTVWIMPPEWRERLQQIKHPMAPKPDIPSGLRSLNILASGGTLTNQESRNALDVANLMLDSWKAGQILEETDGN